MWVDTVCRFFKPPFFTEHGSNECGEKTLTNLFTSYVIADWSRNVNFYRASNCTLNPILFDSRYEGKQPVAWKDYCVEYWLKELQESMDRCTGCCNITEILLKYLQTHAINHSFNPLLLNADVF